VVGGEEGGDAEQESFAVEEEDGKEDRRERHCWVGYGGRIADTGRGVGWIFSGGVSTGQRRVSRSFVFLLRPMLKRCKEGGLSHCSKAMEN
jgi:hypothetical protein